MTGETGVIWCPGCDSVLHWTQEAQGKELDEGAIEHLSSAHGFTPKSRTLQEPALPKSDGVHDEGAEAWLLSQAQREQGPA